MEDIILYLLILIIPAIARVNITTTYSRYKSIKNKKSLTGFEVARRILDENGLSDMYVVEVRGNLTDHYDSSQKVVRLSTEVFHGDSLAAASIAAHECGHAIQDKENYSWMRTRAFLYPIVNFGTNLAYILFFISILLQIVDMLLLSIAIILLGLIFQLVTLPVEFDASKRAQKQLTNLSLLDNSEIEGSEKVLKSAALTYVASVLSSLLNLYRYLLAYDRNRKN